MVTHHRNATNTTANPVHTPGTSQGTLHITSSKRPFSTVFDGSPGNNNSDSDDDVIDLTAEPCGPAHPAAQFTLDLPAYEGMATGASLSTVLPPIATASLGRAPSLAMPAPWSAAISQAEGLRQSHPLRPSQRGNLPLASSLVKPALTQSIDVTASPLSKVAVSVTVVSTLSCGQASSSSSTVSSSAVATPRTDGLTADEDVIISPALREFISNIPIEDGSPTTLDPQLVRRQLGGRNGAPHGLQCDLFDHQAVAVKWMLHMENNSPLCGGLLADDMGMGKTIQTIAMMLHNLPKRQTRSDVCSPKATLIVAPLALLTQWRQEIYDKVEPDVFRVTIHHGPRRARSVEDLRAYDVVLTTYATLCNECPLDGELLLKTLEEAEGGKQGNNRQIPPPSSRNCGPYRRGPLMETYWHRVVLDEGHAIKNFRTRCSRVVSKLQANYRWVLTGTPIQNNLEELFPLFRFLRVKHMEDIRDFRDKVSSYGAVEGSRRAQAILRGLMMRRTKADRKADGTPLIVLTDKTVFLTQADFTPEESVFYKALETRTVETFRRYLKAGTVMKNYSHVLVLLLRLRQACDHVNLVLAADKRDYSAIVCTAPAEQTDKTVNEELERARQILPARVLQRLLEKYAGDGEEDGAGECPICIDALTDAVVIRCGHEFCRECISNCIQAPETRVIDVDDEGPRCPLCRAPTKIEHVISVAAFQPRARDPIAVCESARIPIPVCENDDDVGMAIRPIQDDDDEEGLPSYDDMRREFFAPPAHGIETLPVGEISGIFRHGEYVSSTKIRILLDTLNGYRQQDRSIKTVVFSQFTSMLDLVETPLTQAGFKYCRYDGKMSMSQRDDAVRKLREDDSTSVMLVSMKCGGVGLNLTRASRAVLLDVWWNPAVEDQAIDRIHRIGQENSVEVQRLVIKGTVEERIIELQERKRLLAKGALGEGEAKMGRLTIGDLIHLFCGPRRVNYDDEDYYD